MRNRFTIDTDLVFHGNNNNDGNDSDLSRHPSAASTHSPPSQYALPQSVKPQGEDTDRWVEQQFDLGRYDDQGDGVEVGPVKETDILSDDDEYCKSVRASSAEPSNLEGKMEGVALQDREERVHPSLNGGLEMERESETTHSRVREKEEEEEGGLMDHGGDSDPVPSPEHEDPPLSRSVPLSRCTAPPLKLTPLKKQCAVEGVTDRDGDVIWVRRDDYSNGCNSDVF